MKKIITILGIVSIILIAQTGVNAETVSLNTKSLKYHNSGCQWYNCKNCVKMDKKKAVQKGGKPCKVCGG